MEVISPFYIHVKKKTKKQKTISTIRKTKLES
jgi:hypothetical protein